MISRRRLLIVTAASVAAVGLPGCAAGAIAIAEGTVGKTLADFAVALGSSIVSAGIVDWIEGLAGDEKDKAEHAKSTMVSNGFTAPATNVFNVSGTAFFALNMAGGPECCACFLGGSSDTPLLEGPALLGIALHGKNWNTPVASAADATLPIATISDDQTSFRKAFPKDQRYQTRAGEVRVGYNGLDSDNQGVITVTSLVDGVSQPAQTSTFPISIPT